MFAMHAENMHVSSPLQDDLYLSHLNSPPDADALDHNSLKTNSCECRVDLRPLPIGRKPIAPVYI